MQERPSNYSPRRDLRTVEDIINYYIRRDRRDLRLKFGGVVAGALLAMGTISTVWNYFDSSDRANLESGRDTNWGHLIAPHIAETFTTDQFGGVEEIRVR